MQFLEITLGVALGEVLFTLASSLYLWTRRKNRRAEFESMMQALDGLGSGLENETAESAHV